MRAMLAPLGIKNVRVDSHPIRELEAGLPDREGQPGPGHLEPVAPASTGAQSVRRLVA